MTIKRPCTACNMNPPERGKKLCYGCRVERENASMYYLNGSYEADMAYSLVSRRQSATALTRAEHDAIRARYA